MTSTEGLTATCAAALGLPNLQGLRPRLPNLQGLRPRLPNLQGLRPRLPNLQGLRPRLPNLQGIAHPNEKPALPALDGKSQIL